MILLLISLMSYGNTWESHLKSEIEKQNLSQNISKPCKSSVNDCAYSLMYEMARYESGFKLEATYKESFKDSKGKNVISRGLYQLSVESANQSAYACNVTEKTLHDPLVNISCAVKIFGYWAKRDNTLMSGKRGGCARYWSVCRTNSKSNSKIRKAIQ